MTQEQDGLAHKSFPTNMQNFLIDVEFMVREEVFYIRTGVHNGVPMRDCVGQWESLAKTARQLLEDYK
jgi:hypothetical protein